jgi:hypothetical protein
METTGTQTCCHVTPRTAASADTCAHLRCQRTVLVCTARHTAWLTAPQCGFRAAAMHACATWQAAGVPTPATTCCTTHVCAAAAGACWAIARQGCANAAICHASSLGAHSLPRGGKLIHRQQAAIQQQQWHCRPRQQGGTTGGTLHYPSLGCARGRTSAPNSLTCPCGGGERGTSAALTTLLPRNHQGPLGDCPCSCTQHTGKVALPTTRWGVHNILHPAATAPSAKPAPPLSKLGGCARALHSADAIWDVPAYPTWTCWQQLAANTSIAQGPRNPETSRGQSSSPSPSHMHYAATIFSARSSHTLVWPAPVDALGGVFMLTGPPMQQHWRWKVCSVELCCIRRH